MSVSRAITYIGISSASHGAICAMNTSRMNARRPRHRIRPTAKAASSATTSDISTAPSVTVRLLRQKVPKPTACIAVLKCASVGCSGRKDGVSDWMSAVGLKAVITIQ